MQMRHMRWAFCNAVVMRKALLAIAAIGVTAAVIVGILQTKPTETSGPLSLAQVSKPLDGAPADLAALRKRVNELDPGGRKAFDAQLASLRGHPVVVNMWASWCGPCRAELPFLQREAVQRGADVAFFGVNQDDSHDNATALAKQFPMPYPSVEDPHSELAGRFKTKGLPVTVFYDKRGRLVTIHQGVFPSRAALSQAIDRYART